MQIYQSVYKSIYNVFKIHAIKTQNGDIIFMHILSTILKRNQLLSDKQILQNLWACTNSMIPSILIQNKCISIKFHFPITKP